MLQISDTRVQDLVIGRSAEFSKKLRNGVKRLVESVLQMNLESNSNIDHAYLPPQICMTSTSEVYLVLSTATIAATELRKDRQLASKQCATN